MFGDVAVKLLRLMGHSGTIPSAILAADVPRSLERLKVAVAAERESGIGETQDRDDADEGSATPISLSQRAYPLIELLEAAARQGTDVMWTQSRG